MRWAAVLTLRCQRRAAKMSTGMLNSALQKRLGRLKAATTTSSISTDTFICYYQTIYDSQHSNWTMNDRKIPITLRRSSCRRSGENLTYNFFGISMEDHQKDVENIFTSWFLKLVNNDLPATLLQNQFIKHKEGYKAEQNAKYIENVLASHMDKLGTYLADNIFGRPEILKGERKMEDKKRQMDDLAHRVITLMLELAYQTNMLSVQRAQRKYRAEMAGSDLSVRSYVKTEQDHQKSKELDQRSKKVLLALKDINELDKYAFSHFLEKRK